MSDYTRRSALYALADNLLGYDDGVTTPGERLGKGINALASGLLGDPVGTVGRGLLSVGNDLDDLMFRGGAERRPEDVMGYAVGLGAGGAAMKAPRGALRSYALRGGGRSDPTQTGWTFRDVEGPIPLSRSENKWLSNGMKQETRTEIPIRSLYATQDRVNPDYSTTQTSAGQLPLVVKKGGKFYVRDGHHRLTKAAEEGRQTAVVDLLDFDMDDNGTPLFDYDPAKAERQRREMDAILGELGLLD